MRLLHKDLTYEIRKCIFEVHNKLRPGLDEECYHLALENSLEKNGISVISKPNLFLRHRGNNVHKFIPDIVVEDKVVLELKSIRADFAPAHHIQLLAYLKHLQKDLGLLVNFGQLSAKIKRLPYFERNIELLENYSEIEDFITPTDMYFEAVRECIINILKMHGLGYTYSVYQALFRAELTYQGIPFAPSISMPIKFNGKILRNFELKVPLIASKFFCGITAGQSNIEIHKAAMKNYLNQTNAQFGIIANFTKDILEMVGVRP